MLHKDPFLVAPETFRLIVELQKVKALEEFHLVGGTALTLQIGHRNSIDIDLFTREEFSAGELLEDLNKEFSIIPSFQGRKSTLLSVVNGIKVDFIRHNFPIIRPPITEEGITFLSCEDIAAMKLHAITNSGKRLKDFIDIYYLLERYSMEELVGFYASKYTNYNPMIALRAVSYFEDIDPAMDPPQLRQNLPLKEITKRISEAVLHSKKRF